MRFAVVLAFLLANAGDSFAQRTRFGDFFQVQPTQPAPATSPIITSPSAPATIRPNILPAPAQNFDPFNSSNNVFPLFPRSNDSVIIGQPQLIQPQQQPSYNFFQPNQSAGPNTANAWPNQVWARLRTEVIPRLLERPRFRHSYLIGDEDHEVGINETEIATTMTFANWFGTSQPLRVSPGFVFNFWEGPNTVTTGFDLPSKAYSVYVASDFSTDPQKVSGIETNLTVGFYSDFSNTSTDAIRITGVAVGWRKINSYTTFKLGVEYLDRVDVKLLPAVGVFLTPNPDLMLNIYFPRPKLAQRLPRVGNFEVWGYIGAEYGGGSWAIVRDPLMGADFDDQVDINDVRAFIGTEWLGPRRATAFFEIGYAFEREILYKSNPLNVLDVQDSMFFRAGMAF